MSGIYKPGSRPTLRKEEQEMSSTTSMTWKPSSDLSSIHGLTVEDLKMKLMQAIQDKLMLPWYRILCNEFKWPEDENLIEEMEKEIDMKLNKLDGTIDDAEKNLGENEIREAYTKKAEFIAMIGDKDKAILAFRTAYEKTASLGQRLDLVFHQIRIGFFFDSHDIVKRNIEKAKR
jgi:26S proteasome regulatory subunit N7